MMPLFKKSFLLFSAVLLSSSLASSQTYSDWSDSDDETIIYLDYFGEGSASSGPCPTGVILSSTFAGAAASAEAYFPNVAHISQSTTTTASGGASINWTQTYELLGQQRGGNCGGIATTSLLWQIDAGVSFNVYKLTPSSPIAGVDYYTPINPCSVACPGKGAQGPAEPGYNYALQNIEWLRSTALYNPKHPQVYICFGGFAAAVTNSPGPYYLPPPAPPNTVAPPGTPWTCYDQVLF